MKVCIIWASQNKARFWYEIFKSELSKWHTVYPVTPTYREIDGVKCFENIWKIPDVKAIKLVIFVVNPSLSNFVLAEYHDLLIWKKLWFQPGSYNMETVEYCYKHNFDFEHKNCILKVKEVKVD